MDCKQEVDNANAAQDRRNEACDATSKSLKDKTLKELVGGDAACRKEQKEYEAAKKALEDCVNLPRR